MAVFFRKSWRAFSGRRRHTSAVSAWVSVSVRVRVHLGHVGLEFREELGVLLGAALLDEHLSNAALERVYVVHSASCISAVVTAHLEAFELVRIECLIHGSAGYRLPTLRPRAVRWDCRLLIIVSLLLIVVSPLIGPAAAAARGVLLSTECHSGPAVVRTELRARHFHPARV